MSSVTMPVLTDETGLKLVNAIKSMGTVEEQNKLIENKGTEVLNSIPDDYHELSENVKYIKNNLMDFSVEDSIEDPNYLQVIRKPNLGDEVFVDPTLSIAGYAADAKETGKLKDLIRDFSFSTGANKIYDINLKPQLDVKEGYYVNIKHTLQKSSAGTPNRVYTYLAENKISLKINNADGIYIFNGEINSDNFIDEANDNTIILNTGELIAINEKDTLGNISVITSNTFTLNGLNIEQKNIINKSYVSYRDFGAVLDGITDDSKAVLACHEYANKNGLDVRENNGSLLCNFSVDIYTNCYLNIDFIINDYTPDKVYTIKSPTMVDDFEYKQTLLAGQVDGFLDSVKGKFFVPNREYGEWLLGVRTGDESGDIYYHTQPVAVDSLGSLITSSIIKGTKGNPKVKYCKDISECGIIFSGGRIVTSLSKIGFPTFIYCERNNTIIENISILNKQFPTKTENYPSGLINVTGCSNIIIRNIVGLNNSINVIEGISYIIDLYDSYKILIDNCILSQGWGVIASHFCDTITIINSTINKFDSNYGVFGTYTIRDSIITKYIFLGYGNGNVVLDNVTFTGSNRQYFICTRDDFNVVFSGKLTLSNISFNGTSERIIEYQVGTGVANETDFGGIMSIVALNLTTDIPILDNTTTQVLIPVTISNCTKAMPCTNLSICNIEAYNSTLVNIGSLKAMYINSCIIDSFSDNDSLTGLITMQNCLINCSGKYHINADMISCIFNFNFEGHIINLFSCFASDNTNITAEEKKIINCHNLN